MSYQQITLLGNVGSAPEIKYLANGDAVCNFSLAVNKKRKVDGETVESTTWFRITIFGASGENASQYIEKGAQLLVVGELRFNAYIDKQGRAQASADVTAQTWQLCGPKAKATADSASPDKATEPF